MTLRGQDSRSAPNPVQPDRVNPRADSRGGLRERIDNRRTTAVARPGGSRLKTPTVERVGGTELQERAVLGSRLRDYTRRRDSGVTARGSFSSPLRNDPVSRLKRPHVIYRDRPHAVQHVPRHVHTYHDPHDRLCHRIIWPRYHYPVCYTYGPHRVYRHVYPYYHRKYVFVSLGGYWPLGCSYLRYYWYGWHPYTWYGYYPVPREVEHETYNYYTYNYYTADDGSYTTRTTYTDPSTLADVRQRLAQQQQEPASQTLADTRFEEGVKSFESGDFSMATEKFAAAMRLAPDDVILPFAYAQALFAGGRYSTAAAALRDALKNVDPQTEGVFYPRGLYPDDDVLFGQIEQLLDKLERFGYDADLQLLLGYHLLGVGETAYARAPLEQARQDLRNTEAARALLALLEKMEAEAAADSPNGRSQARPTVQAPSVKAATSAEVLQRLAENAEDADAAAESGATEAPAADNAQVAPPGAEVPEPPVRNAEPGSVLPDLSSEPRPGGTSDSQVRRGGAIEIAAPEPAKKEDDDAVERIQRSSADPSAK